MSALSRRLLLAAAAVAGLATRAEAQAPDAPARVMERYAAALQANDVEALVALYTDNGVFTRPDFAPAVGRDALRAAYKEVFATLKVSLRFHVQEVEVAGDLAWLRSGSTGTVKDLKTGKETADSYHQLVVFRRLGGAWKIREYLYAPAKSSTPAKT